MFLTFWDEYYEFFIILLGIIIGMIIAYIIFFRPNNARNAHKKIKNDTIEDEGDLSFDKFEEEANDEFFSAEIEEFTLGANSNILESMNPVKEEVLERKVDYHIEADKQESDFTNDFEPEEYSKYSKELEKLAEIDKFDSQNKDIEPRLEKIVRDVIPANDYEDQNIGKYHVLFRKDDRRWYVKREGLEEIDKFLLTQKEAIAYATIQALIYATTIVVHDEDGKIAKYEF